MKYATIRNSKGEPIKLSQQEAQNSQYWEKHIQNALGFEIPITTLTTIVKKVSEQKFFEIAPADYIPIVVGQGAWGTALTTYRSFAPGDQFESGIINTGGNNARLASVDAGVDSQTIKIFNWAKAIGWTVFELNEAAKSGNWDLIAAREESRKKNWDLGIQRVAFLGARGANGAGGQCLGLFNQAGVTTNTTLITGAINAMSSTTLNTFVQGVIEAYRSNCNRTAWPTHFIIPESDYNGMAAFTNSSFPLRSVLSVLEDCFKISARNPNFKILPCAYGDKAYSGLSTQMYALLNYDEKSLRMDLPVAYTNTLANTLDGFSFQNAAYGQFTGVLAYRPQEMLYFGF